MEPDLDADRAGRGFLRRLFRRGAAPSPERDAEGLVVALASGKGGTGKSFLTTNLAVALHRTGLRVAIADCDFGLANAHLLLGVNPRLTMQHVLDGAASVQDALVVTPFGPRLLAGGSGVASLAELEARHMQVLARALQWLARNHDVVLLDCAAGLSPQAMITVLASQFVVVVTNPEIAALTDAYALIKCVSRQPGHPPLGLCVNRVDQPGLGAASFERLAGVSQRFAGCAIHYLGEVPEDPQVTHRRLGQPPLSVSHPTCPTTLSIRTLLRALEVQVGGFRTSLVGPGIEARMAAQIRRW